MLEQFEKLRFDDSTLQMIARANEVFREPGYSGMKLTLRQLHYQFVRRNWYANTKASYKKLGQTISRARLAGLIDWSAIEDRVRVPYSPSEFENLAALARAALQSYRLPRWKGQDYYVELWVEKDALAGVLEPMASEFHVTLMVNRGYSSSTAMYYASKRFLEACSEGKIPILLYLGDHDPSGEDMVRDIDSRLRTFGVEVTVQKVALTFDQVREHECPENDVKLEDSRAREYIERFGRHCWEVDALPPPILQALIRCEFETYLDQALMNKVIKKENTDKKKLTSAVRKIMKPPKKKKRKSRRRAKKVSK